MARISPGTMTAAIFAILIGLAGAYAVRQYLNQPPPEEEVVEEPVVEPEPPPEMVYVPTAAREMVAGRTLTINDIVIHSYTREEFRKSEFASKSFMPDSQQIVGRTLRTQLERNGVFQPTDFYSDGEGPGVAELLKPGLRAVTVSIRDIGAVQGFARPGSNVDVLYRADAQDDTPEVTMTLLEGVEVLAVGQKAVPGQTVKLGSGQRSQNGSVTLAVTPHQAKALKVVEGHGELTLALRPVEDLQNVVVPVNQDTVDAAEVGGEKLTLERLVGLKPPKPKKRELVIYRGGAKETISIESTVAVKKPNRFGGLIETPIAGNRRSSQAKIDDANETTLKLDEQDKSSSGADVKTPASVADSDGGGS